jgi:hypothetical protein
MANRLQQDVNATPVVIVDGTTGLPVAGGSGGGSTNSTVQGDTASGTADTGNPVKIGGRYNPSGLNLTTDQRGDLMLTRLGHLKVSSVVGFTAADGFSNSFTGLSQNNVGDPALPIMAGYVFNGTSWDRQRGDTNGTFLQGNVANGATDAGNPLKIGGQANNAVPAAVTSGQRVNQWYTLNGAAVVSNGQQVTIADGDNGTAIYGTGFSGGLSPLAIKNTVFNGTTWDRQRGDAIGTYLNATSTFMDTTTALAANATYNLASRNFGQAGGSRYCFLVYDIYTDQAGTLFLERSSDFSNWRPANGINGTACAAGQSTVVKLPATVQYYRGRFVNGSTAQTSFMISGALSLN